MTIYLLEIAAYAVGIFAVNAAILEYKRRHRTYRHHGEQLDLPYSAHEASDEERHKVVPGQ